MILRTSRRRRFLFVVLAGMEIAWLLPFVYTWIGRSSTWRVFELPRLSAQVLDNPLLTFSLCWLTMLMYMLAVDLVDDRNLDTPNREIVIMVLVIGTTIFGVRLLVYPVSGASSLWWFPDLVRSVFDFSDGLGPPLLFVILNVYLWIRVALAADREISFISVGLSFRLGVLLAIFGGTLLSTIGSLPEAISILFFSLFLTLGLISVALARVEEKSLGVSGSSGAGLPYTRFAQIIATALAIITVALALQYLVHPTAIRQAFHLLDPIWRALGWVVTGVLVVVFLLLGPLLGRLRMFLERMAAGAEPIQTDSLGPLPTDFVGVESMLRDYTMLRHCLVAGTVIVTVAVLWFLFVQPTGYSRSRRGDKEEKAAETSARAPFWIPDIGKLVDLLSLVRRYGMSQHLLNAVTIQNMYANLGRTARTRGHPRRIAEPPDNYLLSLRRAFPGNEPQLERMTNAYMRVHYGDLPVDRSELAALREDYDQIMATPPEEPVQQ